MNTIQTFANQITYNRTLNRAIRSTYVIWSKSYPAWENALFDQSFVMRELKPVLNRFVTGESTVTADDLVAELVDAWLGNLRLSEARRHQWSQKLTPAARDFLWILQGEFAYECQRRERSVWFKLWNGAGTAAAQPVAVAAYR